MATEQLAAGFINGLDWLVDHDETAGMIGITVTGTPRILSQQVFINGQVVADPSEAVIATYGPERIDQFAGQGRQVLISDPSLVGIIMIVGKGQSRPAHFNIWASTQ